jgi:pyrimidine deaminase RibD-like protein
MHKIMLAFAESKHKVASMNTPAVAVIIMKKESESPGEGADDRPALTHAQDAALKQLAANEGEPLALAKILRPVAHFLETYPLDDTEHARIVRGLVLLSCPDAFAVAESGQVSVDLASEVGHYARRLFVYHHPLQVCEDFQLRAMTCLVEGNPLSAIEEIANDILNRQNAERDRLNCEDIWNETYWSYWTVLSWIAFREVARLCENRRGFSRLTRYESAFQKERNPGRLLLAALKNGELNAIRDSKELPALYWADKDEIDRDVRFRRTDVRGYWRGPCEGLARQPENASYVQMQYAYERRKALDQFRDQLEQGAEIRAELEKTYSAQTTEAPSLEALGAFEAVLEVLSGRNAAYLADLSEGAATRYEALKSDLTPERETALRLLAAGQGSAKTIVDVLRSAPSLLDLVPLPYTPRIQAIRELIQIANAGNEWDGFDHDQYWTTGQMVLWAITGDRWAVDQASNDSGRLGEIFGQDRAKVVFDALNVSRKRIRHAADELRRHCLSGHVKALVKARDLQWRPIPAIDWLHLDIVLRMENTLLVVRHGQAFIAPGYQSILFPRAGAEVLREFLPERRPEDQDVTAAHPGTEAIEPGGQGATVETEQSADALSDNATEEERARLIAWIERRLEAPALRDRTHCRVIEIVEDRVPDGNPQRRAEYF